MYAWADYREPFSFAEGLPKSRQIRVGPAATVTSSNVRLSSHWNKLVASAGSDPDGWSTTPGRRWRVIGDLNPWSFARQASALGQAMLITHFQCIFPDASECECDGTCNKQCHIFLTQQ